jgi:hypothetical protein
MHCGRCPAFVACRSPYIARFPESSHCGLPIAQMIGSVTFFMQRSGHYQPFP